MFSCWTRAANKPAKHDCLLTEVSREQTVNLIQLSQSFLPIQSHLQSHHRVRDADLRAQ